MENNIENIYKKVQRRSEALFIDNLVFLRTQMGWTQEQTVEKLGDGVKRSNYEAWESRRAFVPIYFCRKIAILFGTDMDTMLTQKLWKES